jgi:hypothetical protein
MAAGVIYNLNSGAPTTITANNMLYGNGVPDVVNSVNFNELKGVRWSTPGGTNGNFIEGRYFDNNDVFVKVADPQCATLAAPLATNCTLSALAMVVPAGTAGSFVLTDGTGRSAQIVLQNPQPGRTGYFGSEHCDWFGKFPIRCESGKDFPDYRRQDSYGAFRFAKHTQPSTTGFREQRIKRE